MFGRYAMPFLGDSRVHAGTFGPAAKGRLSDITGAPVVAGGLALKQSLLPGWDADAVGAAQMAHD